MASGAELNIDRGRLMMAPNRRFRKRDLKPCNDDEENAPTISVVDLEKIHKAFREYCGAKYEREDTAEQDEDIELPQDSEETKSEADPDLERKRNFEETIQSIGALRKVLASVGIRLTEAEEETYLARIDFKEKSANGSFKLDLSQVEELVSHVYRPAYVYGSEFRRALARGDLEISAELVRRGCAPDKLDGRGMTGLHYAAEAGALESVRWLQQKCASNLGVNKQDRCKWTPIIIAASNGHDAIVRELCNMGADLGLRTDCGRTALHWATMKGKVSTVKLLLQQPGMKKNAGDNAGLTALHCAVINGSKGIVKALLSSGGVDASCKDMCGKTALDYCGPEAADIAELLTKQAR